MTTVFRTFSLALALVACLAAPAFAQDAGASTDDSGSVSGFNLELDLGVGKFFDDGPTGLALTLRPGYRMGFGLTLEGVLGVATGSVGNVNQSLIPFFFGATYGFDAGPVRPFVGAHVGLGIVRVSVPSVNIGFGTFGGSVSEARLGFNVGGGADYMVTDAFGVGASFWFWNMFDDVQSLQMFQAGAHAVYTF